MKKSCGDLIGTMAELYVPTETIVTWGHETVLDDKIQIIPIWKWLLT